MIRQGLVQILVEAVESSYLAERAGFEVGRVEREVKMPPSRTWPALQTHMKGMMKLR